MKEYKDEFFDTIALSKRWHCHRNTIRDQANKGLIPYIKTPGGRKFLFPKHVICEYEQSQLQSGKEVKRQLKKNRIPLTTLKREWRVE